MEHGLRQTRVDLARRSYTIAIGTNARSELTSWLGTGNSNRQIIIIADAAVAELHLKALESAIDSDTVLISFPPGEASKTLATAEHAYTQLAAMHADRDALIVTLGGGVAGDLGGFIAATWLRGVEFVQVATTLLAAMDASVGGKTGVNLPAGKNLVGAFHQPRLVVVDTDFLATLPEREYLGGLAESVKHALIRDRDFLDWHERHVDEILAREPETVAELIERNCAIKAAIVSQDEREVNLRAILNFGHTIGHALEHALDYELRHGECVSLGMVAENQITRERGWLTDEDVGRVTNLLTQLGLPTRAPRRLNPTELLSITRVDKKARQGAVNYVLLNGFANPARVSDVSDAEFAAAIDTIQPA